MVKSANTETVAGRDRFDFWHEVICSAFVRLEAETLPSEQPFQAEIFTTDLGALVLSRVHAQPHTVHRSPSLIRTEPRDQVLVSLQLSGVGVVMQDDREAVLEVGDFALYDATRPYNLVMPGEFDMLVLQFDRQFLLERCPFPEPLTAVRMRSNGKVTAPGLILPALARTVRLRRGERRLPPTRHERTRSGRGGPGGPLRRRHGPGYQ